MGWQVFCNPATQQEMQNKKTRPARSNLTVLRQICNHIPPHLVPRLARDTGAGDKARSFRPWSHVVAMLYAQLTRCLGLNDVCDSLGLHSGALSALRGAKAPSRNGLSHANKVRPAAMAEKLFWSVLEHLQETLPQYRRGKLPNSLRRFRRSIQIIDSTTIELVANSMDWAKHRRRKAAAKTHMRLDMESLLPRFAIVDTAKHNDARCAWALCAGLKAGEIVIFDRAYNDWKHLRELSDRGVFWVGREKKGMVFDLLDKREVSGELISDEEIMLTNNTHARRVTAWVEVDGKRRKMTFLTNHLKWSAAIVCELYKARRQIEVFFKQIKQTLKLGDFLGHSANGVRWQVWTALLVYVLLRFISRVSQWTHSFIRLYAITRTSLWKRMDLLGYLQQLCGTAGGHFRHLARPEQAYFGGF